MDGGADFEGAARRGRRGWHAFQLAPRTRRRRVPTLVVTFPPSTPSTPSTSTTSSVLVFPSDIHSPSLPSHVFLVSIRHLHENHGNPNVPARPSQIPPTSRPAAKAPGLVHIEFSHPEHPCARHAWKLVSRWNTGRRHSHALPPGDMLTYTLRYTLYYHQFALWHTFSYLLLSS